MVVQGKIDRLSHYDKIKMRSLTKCQFLDSFFNEGGDIAIRFARILSRLTIPWRDFIHSSQSIMLFGLPLLQGWPFAALFWKKKHQHAHHIFRQFSSEYFGDSRACSMLYIEYQQARLDSTSADLLSHDNKPSSETNIFNESSFNRNNVCLFQNGSIDIANMHL